jgi:hypothetical protein
MPHQLDLIADTPIARASDPATSHEAAAKVTRTSRASQQGRVLAGLQDHASKERPITSAELASYMRADRHMVARRLPEMRGVATANGEHRPCRVTGMRAQTWYAIGRTT